MSDFEMPYFVDGGGNKGYFKDTTARNKIGDLSQTGVSGDDAADQIGSLNNFKCEGGITNYRGVSIPDQMDALKAAGRSGLFPFYISSANPDFSTTGYCMAIGAILNGGVSTITAVNSQTGDVWTNGNLSQNAGAWTGYKNNSAISLIKRQVISAATDIDVGSGNGVFLVLVAQDAGIDMVGLYVVKITAHSSGTVVKTILSPQSYAPTVTATARTSSQNGKISITPAANCNIAIYKFNLF